jgi:hypothetical protein
MNRKQKRGMASQIARIKPKQKERFANMLSHFKTLGLEKCQEKANEQMSSTDKSALQSAIIELHNEKLSNNN